MSRRANASYQSPNFSEIRSTFAATSANDSPPLRKPGCIVRVAFFISSRTTLRISHTRPVPMIARAAKDVAMSPTTSAKSTIYPLSLARTIALARSVSVANFGCFDDVGFFLGSTGSGGVSTCSS